MDLVVRHEDREEKVHIEPVAGSAGRFRVTFGDTVHLVDWAARPGGVWSLISDGSDGFGGEQHEVAILPHGRADEGRYRVSGNQSATEVQVADPLTYLAQISRGGVGGGGPQQVDAYMPGRVVAVLVEEGQEVEAGQGVIVLEAMKMENEIAAEHAGTIGRILVTPGQAVEGGTPLFEIR